MELTKEHFDQTLTTLYKKFDTKIDDQTKEMKAYAKEQTEELARIIATTIAEPMERHFEKINKELDVYAEVKQLKADMERIKKALQISPSRA